MTGILSVLKPDPEIKAVIIDFDINMNWARLLRAASILKNENVIFLIGPRDKKLPISKTQSLIGKLL